jgi:hypothetical protein
MPRLMRSFSAITAIVSRTVTVPSAAMLMSLTKLVILSCASARGSWNRTQKRKEEDAKGADQEKETFGTARSAALSISKNAACLNANQEAMTFEGTCSIMTLKSRTVPL